jgi:glycosyltransferase involved in cell wall biosynthesis
VDVPAPPQADTFIFNSNALQGSNGPGLLRAAPDSPQVVIHNAVDTRVFRPRPRPGSPPRVGILANFMPVKRHEDFLLMAQSVLEKRPDAEFWLIGDDIHGTGREDALRRLGRGTGHRFAGEVLGDIARTWPGRSSSSRRSSALRALSLSAVASSSPWLAGGPWSRRASAACPRWFSMARRVSWSRRATSMPCRKPVLRLINEPALWQRMSDAGIQDVQNRFSIEQHARETLAVYEELVKPVQRAVGEPTLL